MSTGRSTSKQIDRKEPRPVCRSWLAFAISVMTLSPHRGTGVGLNQIRCLLTQLPRKHLCPCASVRACQCTRESGRSKRRRARISLGLEGDCRFLQLETAGKKFELNSDRYATVVTSGCRSVTLQYRALWPQVNITDLLPTSPTRCCFF